MVKLGMDNSKISKPTKYYKSQKVKNDSYIIRLVVPAGTKFLEKIGFRYNIEKALKLTAANAYWRYRETNIENKTSDLENNIISKTNTFGLIDIFKHYYKAGYNNNIKQKTQNKVSVIKFFKDINCLHWFNGSKSIIDRYSTELPYYTLKLVDKVESGKANVWDINVKNTHSFIANGIVVHNCFEPYTENIYTRSTFAGDYYIINKHLMKDLMELGLWNSDMIDLIKYYEGSISNIPNIPDNIKKIYRTVWEIPQKSIIEMAADRGPFIDQTQSMNIFIAKANFAKLNSCLFYAWKKGLKTGIYYLRSKAASEANQFGIDINKIKEIEEKYNLTPKTNINNTDIPNNKQNIQNKTEMRICKLVPKHLRKPGDCEVCGS